MDWDDFDIRIKQVSDDVKDEEILDYVSLSKNEMSTFEYFCLWHNSNKENKYEEHKRELFRMKLNATVYFSQEQIDHMY